MAEELTENPEETPGVEADDPAMVSRLRKVVLQLVYRWTPKQWYEDPETIALLDKVKPLLAPRDRRKLTAWLAKSNQGG